MIILPDRNIPRAKILIPLHSLEWRTPSHSQQKDFNGNENHTLFRVRARANDGGIVWTGWFEDRDDADAFIHSVITGNIKREKYLWSLCTPNWNPDISDLAVYEIHSQTYLSSNAGSIQEWNVPSDWCNPNMEAPPFIMDMEYFAFSSSPTFFISGTSDSVPVRWNNGSNAVEAIGGGGSMINVNNLIGCSTGGAGGGAYAKAVNITLTAGGSVSYQIGIAGGTTGSGTTPTGNSFLKDGSTLVAAGGASITGQVCGSNGLGGTTANSVGNTKYKGGDGGTGRSTGGSSGGGGGGGAAGMNGAGVNGQSRTGESTGGNGGAGDNGFGGAGGTGTTGSGNPGGNGTEWSASYGSGGGGSGAGAGVAPGSVGGNYGGAAGGPGNVGTFGPYNTAGKQGLIVITYVPSLAAAFNSPINGI